MGKKRVFAVFGLGAFGSEVCRYLSENGQSVIALDNQSKLIDKIKETVKQAFLIDSTDEEALTNLPLEDVDVAVVGIGDDIEASILTTALLKKIGIPFIIARAVNEIHFRVLKQIGADEIVNLEIDEGRLIAQRLMSSDILDTIPISQNFSIAEIYIPAEFVGRSLKALEEKLSVKAVAVKRWKSSVDDMGNPMREEIVRLPDNSDIIQENDILLVVGKNTDIDSLKE
ncbi:MAG TPA: TrkA family potassium uptake protein [Spirochaetia bacterium]|nr:TrkA family potassium uptake protein [Spirochaetia bacterium]